MTTTERLDGEKSLEREIAQCDECGSRPLPEPELCALHEEMACADTPWCHLHYPERSFTGGGVPAVEVLTDDDKLMFHGEEWQAKAVCQALNRAMDAQLPTHVHLRTALGEPDPGACESCGGTGNDPCWEQYKSEAVNRVLSSEIKDLEGQIAKMRNAVGRCREFVKTVYDFRADVQIDEGGMPFGTLDYYAMEDLTKDLDEIEGTK